MATTVSQRLTQTQDAISALLTAISDSNVQEYDINGRRVKRAEFGRTLDSLRQLESHYLLLAARQNRQSVSVVKFGRPRRVDR